MSAMLAFADDDMDCLDEAEVAAVAARRRWLVEARRSRQCGKQIPPDDDDWQILLLRAGRGWGKTRSLTEWLWWEMWRCPALVGHAIAPTISDVVGTLFEGPAGLLSVIPNECLRGGSVSKAYTRQRRELRLRNGSLIRGFGAQEEGGRLRGPQSHALIGDELREWEKPAGNLEQALNNALFGLRLPYPDGTPARAVLGTTPKPIPFLKRFTHREGVRLVTGTSYENLANLSPTYRGQLLALAGTLLGKQEIEALFIDEESDLSIIKRSWVKLWPADKKLPELTFILESYDTAASEENYDGKKQNTDPTGSCVFGVFNVKQVFTAEEIKKLGVKGKYAAILLDCWSERLGLPDLLEKARVQHRIKWGVPPRRADVVLIENASSGPGMRQFLAKWGVPTWPINTGRHDKAMRLHAVSPIICQGGLFVPESAREDRKGLPRDWVEPFLEQVCAFAGEGSVEHDEMIDCLSGAYRYLHERHLLDAEPEEQHLDLEAKIDADREEADRLYQAQKRREVGNPYG